MGKLTAATAKSFSKPGLHGDGATWESFYGARSWLVPGLVAGVLTLFDNP